MDIEALLNSTGEYQVINESTDQEIYHAVMDAIKACENLEINGNDHVDEDAPVEPCPTCHKFYQAASVITRYMDDMDDPIARRIEMK